MRLKSAWISIPARAEELAALTRDYDVATQNYKSLMDKKLAAGMRRTRTQRRSGSIVLVDAAQTPQQPFQAEPDVLKLVALAVAFVISAVFVVG